MERIRSRTEADTTAYELNDAFFSSKVNKSPGYNKNSFNVIKKCFGSLHEPWKFPDELTIARLTSLFRNGSTVDLENYRLTSFLPCFLKNFEKIV